MNRTTYMDDSMEIVDPEDLLKSDEKAEERLNKSDNLNSDNPSSNKSTEEWINEGKGLVDPPLDDGTFWKLEDQSGDLFEQMRDLAESSPTAWNAIRRHVRERAKADDDLPNVGDVDAWAKDIQQAATSRETKTGDDPTFSVGDAVDISRQLERDVQQTDQPLVFDYGEFHQYTPASGLWEVVPTEALSRQVQTYSGAADYSGEEPRPLKVSGRKKSDAIDLFRDRIHRGAKTEDDRGYFDESPRGLMFDNAFLRVVDLERIDRETPGAHHRARIGAGVPFDPEADAPMFDAYLDSVFDRDPWADQKRDLLLEFCGACLLGIAPAFERALVLYDATQGSGGANGKSVLIKLLSQAFARSATSQVSPQEFDGRFSTHALAGARINYVTELPEGEIIASDTLKSVITGDPMRAEQKYCDPYWFRPRAGHIFAANDLPRVVATDGAFWRRWMVLPFNNRFTPPGEPGRDRIKGLDEKIAGEELPGVLARMIDGAKRLLEQGTYTTPASVDAAKRTWRRESNPIEQFLIDETVNYTEAGPQYDTEAGWHREPTRRTQSSVLYEAYTAWSDATGHGTVSQTKFGRRVGKLIHGKRTSGAKYYRIRLKDRSDRVGSRQNTAF